MRHSLAAQYQNVRLAPLSENDIELLRNWRNSPQNTQFLRKLPHLTADMQKKWFQSYLQEDSCCTFSICMAEGNKTVGSVCLYDIDQEKKQCEWGRFMIGEQEAHGKGIGFKALLLCLHIGFQKFGLNRIYGSVHEKNMPARKVDDKAGFVVYGTHPFDESGDELEIEITKEHFYELHPEMKDVLISEVI